MGDHTRNRDPPSSTHMDLVGKNHMVPIWAAHVVPSLITGMSFRVHICHICHLIYMNVIMNLYRLPLGPDMGPTWNPFAKTIWAPYCNPYGRICFAG